MAKQQEFHIKYWKIILLFIESLSLILIFLGLFFNPIILKWILAKETMFSTSTIHYILIVEMLLIGLGIFLWLFKLYYLSHCSTKAKEVTLQIIFILIFLFFILFLLEGTIRIFFPQETLQQVTSSSPAIYEDLEYISWGYKSNSTGYMRTHEFNVSYYINSLGIRSRKEPLIYDNNQSLLILGDSFTAGFGVEYEDTFSALLEEKLGITVFNAGVDGYSADSEYVYLVNNIEKLKPDHVLVSFYAGNDVMDISKNSWETKTDLPIKVTSQIMEVIDSRLVLLDNDLNPYRSNIKTYFNILLSKYSHFYLLLKNFFVLRINTEIIPLLTSPTETIDSNWEKTEILLGLMKNVSEDHNASFTLVIIPARVQVEDEVWNVLEKRFNNIQRDRVQERLKQWCFHNEASCIDILDYIKSEKGLYYSIDLHFNEKGHKRTSEILVDSLPLEK